MTGVIWLIQLLVYPNFKRIGEIDFQSLHQFHLKQIPWVVGPVMTLELVSGVWIFVIANQTIFFWNLVSVAALWIWTAFINVPSHTQLRFRSEASKRSLVGRNWPRTLLWTARSILLMLMMLGDQT